MNDFMPPKPWPPTHDIPPPVHEPRTRKERKEKARGSSSNAAPPQTPICVNWDDDIDDFMPTKSWPPTHDVCPPVHEPRTRKERKGKSRGSSSHATPPAAHTCRAVGLLAAPPPGGRGLHAIELKF